MIEAFLIMFSCTMFNHLGLIDAIESAIGKKVPIVNCCKCFTFWASLVYLAIRMPIIESIAFSFLLAFLSVWFELVLGLIDKVYDKIYCKAYDCKATEEHPNSTNSTYSEEGMPEL